MTNNGIIEESLPGTIDQMEVFFTPTSKNSFGESRLCLAAGGSSPLGEGCYLHRENGTVNLCGPREEVERQAFNFLYLVVSAESNGNGSRQ